MPADLSRGHKVGDTWTTEGASPNGLCLGAPNSLTPAITALRFGGNFPWMKEPAVIFACPDHVVQRTCSGWRELRRSETPRMW